VLCRFQVEPQTNTRCLEFVEIKDYLADSKRSGWQALKSVVRWADKTFEIQIQTLQNYMREREYLTQESHTSFKMNRERVREQVAQKNPLFQFYRQLLRWLFLAPHKNPPVYPGIRVCLSD
jgi:(p)ppGpp synthase/HD superfamily hydrolase